MNRPEGRHRTPVVPTVSGLPPASSAPGADGPQARSDAVLVGQVEDRDAGALEVLFHRHGGACLGVARRLLGDDTLAQDVVQDVFLALWHGSARYDEHRGGFRSWLLRVTHHKGVDLVRREEGARRRNDAAQRLADEVTSESLVPDEAISRVRGEEVRHALAGLSEAHREVLLLAYYGGYTQVEIASMTGLPLGTVKTRTLAGMRRLRSTLADQAPKEAGS